MSPEQRAERDRKRFFAAFTVGEPDECWPWERSTTRGGYGHITVGGVRMNASRASLILHGVEVGPDMVASHSCDNPPCVNPAHLSPKTQSQNMLEAFARGRGYSYFRTDPPRDSLGRPTRREPNA